MVDARPDHGDMRHYDADRRHLLALARFLETDRFCVRRKQAFLATVERKLHTGSYSHKLAPKLWAHWVKEGLPRYLREHPRADAGAFDRKLVRKLAKEVADRERTRIARKDYPDLTVAGEVGTSGRLHMTRW